MQSRPRSIALASLMLSAALVLVGCSSDDDGAADEAAAQARADALRAELEAFVLPGGEIALEPSALIGADAGTGYHAETLFGGRAADGPAIVAEAGAALEAAGLAPVTELPDGSAVPAEAGTLSTGYWGGGDWVVGAQAGVRLAEDGAQSGDLVLQYVFLDATGSADDAVAGDAALGG